jgi:hypothetical protein
MVIIRGQLRSESSSNVRSERTVKQRGRMRSDLIELSKRPPEVRLDSEQLWKRSSKVRPKEIFRGHLRSDVEGAV